MPKAIRFHTTDGPDALRWEDVEVGHPGAGQARVRHTAVGVNYIDTYHRSGLYPVPLPADLLSDRAKRHYETQATAAVAEHSPPLASPEKPPKVGSRRPQSSGGVGSIRQISRA